MVQTKERAQERIGEPQRELLKRIHEEHDELRGTLRSLRERVRDAAARSGEGGAGARARAEAESLAGELEQRLPPHFAAEERAGFLSEAVDQAPRLSRRADALCAEHAQLAAGLSALRARMHSAGQATHGWQKLDTECRRFAEAFHEHESRENELICEAWLEDVGAVD